MFYGSVVELAYTCVLRVFKSKKSLINHVIKHTDFIKKQKDNIAYYIATGYTNQEIISQSEIIFSMHWLKNKKHDDKYLLAMRDKYLNEIKNDIVKLFLDNHSIKDIKTQYKHLSLKLIRDYIKGSVGDKTFYEVVRKNKNNRISIANSEFYSKKPKIKHFAICSVCGKTFEYDSPRKCCSKECLHKTFVKAGQKSAMKQNKRSKNEIYFAELCMNYFQNVLCNAPIFNGWDADIIIKDYKVAVLWNGIWHYKKITKKHSIKQVKNRDAIKIHEIRECGYKEYIIKDLGSFDKKFVELQFDCFVHEFLQL